MFVRQGDVFKPENPYDDDAPEYDHLLVTQSGNYSVVDCWVCDSQGNIHQGYAVSPVPVAVADLGNRVSAIEGDGND